MGEVLPYVVPLDALEELDRRPSSENPVEEAVVRRLEVARVRRYLRQLPVKERQAICLRYGIDCRECSPTGAAERLGVCPRTERALRERALRRLAACYRGSDPAA